MPLNDWAERCSQMLARRREQHLLRQRPIVTPIDATHIEIDGRRLINFASNNYLGLTHHPRMRAAIERSLAGNSGWGSAAAGLISGHTTTHARAEEDIARWKQTESAILLPSGYQANLAAVQTLAAIGKSYKNGVRFLIDKLSHASIIDAVHAAGAAGEIARGQLRVFPHNQLPKLRRLLEDAEPEQLQVVMTESIFSMDGDAADLHGIVTLKREFPFILLVDEAHGSGVYGPGGSGLACELGLQKSVDISIVTLSKALACSGGAICANESFCNAVLNFGRAYIFSTSIPPMIAGAVSEAIAIMRDEPHHQHRVRDLARQVRAALSDKFQLVTGDSPIIPIILGDESKALETAERLREKGIFVQAVRPPTVPAGGSRLRVTLSAGHSDQAIADVLRLF